MAKPKSPLLSLSAYGTLGNALTFQRRGKTVFTREKPTPTDRKSLPQLYQRWLYEDYVAYWNDQTAETKRLWETNARPLHITGFAYWIKYHLTNLPDIAGGWHLDFITGGAVIDFSKNANHGTVYGASITDGRIDKALWFDSVDDYINCGNDPSLNITADLHFTWECFTFSYTQAFDYGTLMGYVVWNWPALWHATWAEYIRFRIKFTSAGAVDITAFDAPRQKWLHIAATWDGQYVRVFIDGEQKGISPDLTGDTLIAHSADFFIGKMNTYRHKGIIDEVRFYNRALTPSDIKRHSERRYPL